GAWGVPGAEDRHAGAERRLCVYQRRPRSMGLGFLITTVSTPGKHSAGSLIGGSIHNTHFWLDSSRGVAGILLMQFLPFVGPSALDALDSFERGVYESFA